MAVVQEVRGPLWVDGHFTVRVRGPVLGPDSGRTFRVRRPFALIGRMPGSDLRIDDPAVDARHAFLLLDRRGLLGVDLLSRTGTRFAAEETAWAWLGPGDLVEIAGYRAEILQLHVNGSNIRPPLSSDDPFAQVHHSELVPLRLEPLGEKGPPWMLGSALAFVGRGDACVIRIDDPTVSDAHCALMRTHDQAFVIDLLGRATQINGRTVEGASRLFDRDVLSLGRTRFTVRIDAPATPRMSNRLSVSPATNLPATIGPAPETLVARIIEAANPSLNTSNHEILDVLRQFQADAATLLEAQIERIEALNREIASLRAEIQGPRTPVGPPATPLRLDLTPPPLATTDESASWLLERLGTLETESRSTWKDLIGRIGASASPRIPPEPGRTLASTPSGTPRRDDR